MKSIVIAVHGCPAHVLGPYGNEWIVTPALDRIAAEGVVFDRHFAMRPQPLAARDDWWQGDWPGPQRIVRWSSAGFDAPLDQYARFAERFDARHADGQRGSIDDLLSAADRALASFAGAPDGTLWFETDRLLPPWSVSQELFESYCDESDDGPVEEAEPLVPWCDPPIGWFDTDDLASWEWLHRTHAAAVSGFDAELGRLIELIEAHPWGREATLAVTADFGFPLGEHGLLGPHRPWLYAEFVQVPLIVRFPSNARAGERVSALTCSTDLAKLVAGVSTTCERIVGVCELKGTKEAMLRTESHALLLPLQHDSDDDRKPQLFAKPEDRWERNDIAPAERELAEAMEAELRTVIGDH